MEQEFILKLKETLEIEDRDINLEDNFREYDEWDSLANLSTIAMLDDEYEVVIPNEEFRKLTTVGELLEEIKSRANIN